MPSDWLEISSRPPSIRPASVAIPRAPTPSIVALRGRLDSSHHILKSKTPQWLYLGDVLGPYDESDE
jgi:hypothetical protein